MYYLAALILALMLNGPAFADVQQANPNSAASGAATPKGTSQNMMQTDWRDTLTVASSVANAAATTLLQAGQATLVWEVAGLTAAGAQFAIEASANGTVWRAATATINGSSVSTVVADSTVVMAVSGYRAVRLRINVQGTGNVTVAYNASIAPSVQGLSVAPVTPPTPTGAQTFPSTIATTSTALFTGSPAARRLVVFNNSTGSGAPTLWCNESGGVAVANSGIAVPPYGGAFMWPDGLTTIPRCVSDGGVAGTTAVTVSGSGS